MGLAAAPSQRLGMLAFAALVACPALADAQMRQNAVDEKFTCANLAPKNAVDPEAVLQIGRAIALVHNTGSLPEGSERARVVLRLCFNRALSKPVIDLIDYSGPVGEVADATEAAARRALMRALNAGTLNGPLDDLTHGRPENAVIDLVFGPSDEAGQ
ncbi:hypothetical protein HOY34_02855 [Xinfangfangia sp. D13-10-4-6]|uniref:hypothetical protein n=1 Tax=Pseudogemmobacter hezensis TaxID=2737662 RepID=UPI001552C74C|nr:hypothetical protein [Pseudogemmobacter hezensis]NPD14135.1 hypothetical protein [Pseudogemmobacter hezensis]